MNISSWTTRLSTENAELDEQHITLMEIGRSIVTCIEQQGSSKNLVDLLEDFVALARVHDQSEESILERNQCPSLIEHQQIHTATRQRFEVYLLDEKSQGCDRQELAAEVQQWAGHHISERDMTVRKYLVPS